MRQKFNKLATKSFFDEKNTYLKPEILSINNKKCILEIGSGKGKFITEYALKYPNVTFVAVEMNRHVAYHILKKIKEKNISNLHLIVDSAKNLLYYLNEKTVSSIYLNFSDPWPKKKHHKRRLTHPNYLKIYKTILKRNGKIFFRTDQKEFYFDSSLYLQSYFEKISYTQNSLSLPIMSEYELKKRKLGPIYSIEAEGINE